MYNTCLSQSQYRKHFFFNDAPFLCPFDPPFTFPELNISATTFLLLSSELNRSNQWCRNDDSKTLMVTTPDLQLHLCSRFYIPLSYFTFSFTKFYHINSLTYEHRSFYQSKEMDVCVWFNLLRIYTYLDIFV